MTKNSRTKKNTDIWLSIEPYDWYQAGIRSNKEYEQIPLDELSRGYTPIKYSGAGVVKPWLPTWDNFIRMNGKIKLPKRKNGIIDTRIAYKQDLICDKYLVIDVDLSFPNRGILDEVQRLLDIYRKVLNIKPRNIKPCEINKWEIYDLIHHNKMVPRPLRGLLLTAAISDIVKMHGDRFRNKPEDTNTHIRKRVKRSYDAAIRIMQSYGDRGK